MELLKSNDFSGDALYTGYTLLYLMEVMQDILIRDSDVLIKLITMGTIPYKSDIFRYVRVSGVATVSAAGAYLKPSAPSRFLYLKPAFFLIPFA